MTDTLFFPALGWEIPLNRIAFTVGSVSIYWYGILLTLGFLAGALYALKRSRIFGIDPDRAIDVIMGGTVLGIVCARIYYVIFKWDEFQDNLMNIFNTRLGGLAIYGGVIGAFLACYFVGKWRKVPLLPGLDCAAAGIMLGQAIGRWGNFVNMEAFGSNTAMPWGMTSDTIAGYLQLHRVELESLGMSINPAQPVHPTFFYESIWCLAGFLFIAWYTKRRRFDGELGLIYLAWYGLGRMFIEGLRTDSLLVGFIRVSQLLAALCVIASVIALVTIHSRIKREGDSEFMKLYVETPIGQAVLHGMSFEQAEKFLAGDVDEDKDGIEDSEDESGSEPEAPEPDDTGGDDEGEAEDAGQDEPGSDGTDNSDKADADATIDGGCDPLAEGDK